MRALVADDYPLVRKLLGEILGEDCGFARVDEAGDGLSALELLEASDYSLAILDVDMPKLDGLSVLRSAAPKAPGCAFIVLSGLDEQDYRDRALALGASAYLVKGCPPEAIAAAARRALAERRSALSSNRRNDREEAEEWNRALRPS